MPSKGPTPASGQLRRRGSRKYAMLSSARQAPLAQSAERLHGKYLARIGVLTSENAVHPRPVWTQLDALVPALCVRQSVTHVTRQSSVGFNHRRGALLGSVLVLNLARGPLSRRLNLDREREQSQYHSRDLKRLRSNHVRGETEEAKRGKEHPSHLRNHKHVATSCYEHSKAGLPRRGRGSGLPVDVS
jgi:hypothetical protein